MLFIMTKHNMQILEANPLYQAIKQHLNNSKMVRNDKQN